MASGFSGLGQAAQKAPAAPVPTAPTGGGTVAAPAAPINPRLGISQLGVGTGGVGQVAAPDVLGGQQPVALPAAAPQPAGGGFGPVQGAGFGAGGTTSFSDFGVGVNPQLQDGQVGPNQFGNTPIPPQMFGGTGVGGFSATPRVLTSAEVNQLSQNLGIAGTSAQFNPNSFRARQLLGPLGFIADPSRFNRAEVPFIETRLNFENLLQAQQDRQSALNLLQQQRGAIGQSPAQQQALSVALSRLQSPEPFTPEEVGQQQSAIRQRGAQSFEAAQRQQQEALAQQGVRGGVTAFQEAQQRQAASRQVSDELQRLAIENALGRDVNEAQAIDRLRQIAGEDESRQIAINNLLSELLTAQRGEFDLSALTAKERKAERGLLSKIGFF
jgi:hypothetical protein